MNKKSLAVIGSMFLFAGSVALAGQTIILKPGQNDFPTHNFSSMNKSDVTTIRNQSGDGWLYEVSVDTGSGANVTLSGKTYDIKKPGDSQTFMVPNNTTLTIASDSEAESDGLYQGQPG